MLLSHLWLDDHWWSHDMKIHEECLKKDASNNQVVWNGYVRYVLHQNLRLMTSISAKSPGWKIQQPLPPRPKSLCEWICHWARHVWSSRCGIWGGQWLVNRWITTFYLAGTVWWPDGKVCDQWFGILVTLNKGMKSDEKATLTGHFEDVSMAWQIKKNGIFSYYEWQFWPSVELCVFVGQFIRVPWILR